MVDPTFRNRINGNGIFIPLAFFLIFLFVLPGLATAAPVADAGNDQEVLSGQTVYLDGSGSTGDIVYYQWSQLSGPNVDLGVGAEMAQASFTAPQVAVQTELVFNLFVMDTLEQGDNATVSIWVIPVQNGGEGPTADAGDDQFVNEGNVVTLDGSGSTGTELSYTWEQTGGSHEVFLDTQADSAQAEFLAPATGGERLSLTFQLTVTDSRENMDTDSVTVSVYPPEVSVAVTPFGDPLGIRVSSGSNLNSFIVTSTDAYTQTVTASGPEPLELPHGLTDISISQEPFITDTGVYTATATFYLPTAAPPNYGWAKLSLSENAWIDFSDNVVFNPGRTVVTMTLTDGGPGDDNPTSGIIDDPSGLALMPGADEGNGGNGCFIMICWPR